MITVVIPVYNRKDYLLQAVESIFSQQAGEVEVIAVDDGSTDGSFELLEGLASNDQITLLTHELRANRGQSAAINLGIARAKGKYIAILDSDDWFASNKLKHQCEYLDSNPEIGMVYGKGIAVDSTGNELYSTLADDHVENGDPNRILLDCFIAIPGGALIRKSVLDAVGGFEESFRASQDHDMAIRLYEATQVSYLPEVAFYYRKHSDSISQQGLERRWKLGFEILNRAKQRWKYKPETLRKRKAVLHYHLGKVRLGQGRYFAALRQLLQCALLDPARSIRVLIGHEKAS